MCQLGCSQILMNKLMTASISHPVCKILDVCQSCVCLWLDYVHVCIHAFLVVFPSIYEAFLHMCVCALQAVWTHAHAHPHAHMYTLEESKQNQLVCFKHISKTPEALGPIKDNDTRCRRDSVECCNLSSRSLTWWQKTAGFSRICSSDLLRGFKAGLNVTLCQVTMYLISFMNLPHFL